MYEQIIPSVAKTISGIFLSLSILFGATPPTIQPTVIPEPQVIEHTNTIVEKPIYLGANISSIADFRTSLSSGIDNSTTTMTLVSFSSGSDSLIVGETYGFKIGGREYVLGTAAANNKIIGMTRGLSRKTATTTFSSYIETWGRGTSVEITDAPLILDLGNKLTGKAGIDTPIRYDTSVATTSIDDNNANLVNYELLTYTAFNGAGVINASQTQKGLVEIATQLETASSTPTGSTGATLAIPASNATSTYNSATAALRVVTTQNNGKIDNNFIASSTLFGTGTATFQSIVISGTSNIASSSIYATTTTGTWTKPANLRYLIVEVQGGGGSGKSTSSDGEVGGGGGGGGYAVKVIPASAIGATETVTVGSVAGTTSFGSHVSATGGTTATTQAGADGGTGVGGDVNISGQRGGTMWGSPSAPSVSIGGDGGDSQLGKGGRGSYTSSGGSDGEAGKSYGGGGGGAGSQAGSQNGGTGASGIVIFHYFFY